MRKVDGGGTIPGSTTGVVLSGLKAGQNTSTTSGPPITSLEPQAPPTKHEGAKPRDGRT